MPQRLQDAQVVITGAGAGLGRALALELAAKYRARLVLSDRDAAGAAETARLALAAGAAAARSVVCDVTRIAEVEALAASCAGKIDLLINNAGVCCGGAVGETPLEDWRWVIDVDLYGVIHGCHAFVPRLKKQGSGHILNVASAAGLLSGPKMAAYNVAKAGVVALSETLATELMPKGIGVTILCPTYFQTDLIRNGRFANDRLRTAADSLLRSGTSAEPVAAAALRSVAAGELYCLPNTDAKWMWRAKRLAPELFPRLNGSPWRLKFWASGAKKRAAAST